MQTPPRAPKATAPIASAPVAGVKAVTSSEKSCAAERGVDAARDLANRCWMVSGSTYPPCNPSLTCSEMQGHIDYFCKKMGVVAPECVRSTHLSQTAGDLYKADHHAADPDA